MNRVMAAVVAIAAAVVLAGCVSLPTGGEVNQATLRGSSGQPVQGIQLVATRPADGWQPKEIVAGFLAASGSSAGGGAVSRNPLKVARSYLSPQFARTWQPDTAATVIDAVPSFKVTTIPPTTRINGAVSGAQVNVTSQHVEMLKSPGNIVVSPTSHTYQFQVIQVRGQWRIDSIYADGTQRHRLLLLLRPDFERDYQPRDLYFFPAGSPARTLVPDPVFIPQQQDTQAGVRALVGGLLTPAAGWMGGAVTTAFPARTKIQSVQVSGVTAVVRLGGAASRASPDQLRRMAAQLVWTLTSSPYSTLAGSAVTPTGTGIESVELQVRGRASVPLLLRRNFVGYLAAGTPAAGSLFYQPAGASGPRVDGIRPGTQVPVVAALPRQVGSGPFTAIASSPVAAGTPELMAACRGRAVYVLPLRLGGSASAAPLIHTQLPTGCTSLGWDSRGDLWATAGTGVYVLQPASPGAIRHQAFVQALSEPGSLSELRVAPDGVRIAMIEGTRSGGQVLVAAISRSSQPYLALNPQTVRVGSDLSHPVTLAWKDPDHLFVIGRSGGVQQLFGVPLNGGESTQLPNLLPLVRITSLQVDPPGLVVVGTAGPAPAQSPDEIWVTRNASDGPWKRLAAGSTPSVGD